MRHWPPTLRDHARKISSPRVGITFTRKLEYIDLRGAPWILNLSGESGEPENLASASSSSYKSSKLSSDSLTEILSEVDEFVKVNQRIPFESSSTHYSQVGFKDSLGDNWDVEFVTGNLQGYYGFQWGIVVGPGMNKTDLKRIVEKYLKRLEGEKTTSTKYGTGTSESFVTDAKFIDLEVPQEATKSEKRFLARHPVLESAFVLGAMGLILAGAGYLAWATWMKGAHV
jgi:hypothetical protein